MPKRIPATALPVLGLLLLTGLYWLYWSAVADRLRTGVTDWAVAQEADGIRVTWDALRVRGFPTQLRLELDNPAFDAFGAGEGRWAVTMPEFHAHALPYRLDHLIGSVKSPVRLERGPAGRAETWIIEAASAQASYVMDEGRPVRVALDIQDAAATRLADSAAVAAGRFQIHARRVAELAGTADVAIRAEAVTLKGALAPGLAALLGPEIARAAAQTRVTAAAGAGVFDDLALLRLEGGTVQVSEGFADWGPAGASFSGRLDIDGAGTANGRFDTRLTGTEAIVAALVREGLIDPSTEGPVKAALSFMSAASGDAGGGIRAPVTIRNGTVYLGPVRVTD